MIQALKRFLGLGSPEYPLRIPATSQKEIKGNPVFEDHLRKLAETIDPEQVRVNAGLKVHQFGRFKSAPLRPVKSAPLAQKF